MGACSISWYTRGSIFKSVQFPPGSCSQIFKWFNVVEHFAGLETLLPRMNYTHEINGTDAGALLPDLAPGAKPLTCVGLKKHLDVERALFTCMQLCVDGLLFLLDSGMTYF